MLCLEDVWENARLEGILDCAPNSRFAKPAQAGVATKISLLRRSVCEIILNDLSPFHYEFDPLKFGDIGEWVA